MRTAGGDIDIQVEFFGRLTTELEIDVEYDRNSKIGEFSHGFRTEAGRGIGIGCQPVDPELYLVTILLQRMNDAVSVLDCFHQPLDVVLGIEALHFRIGAEKPAPGSSRAL